MIKLKVSNRLRELRELGGYSRPELAKRADVAIDTLRKNEEGLNYPTFIIFFRLLKGLEVTPSEFFDFGVVPQKYRNIKEG